MNAKRLTLSLGFPAVFALGMFMPPSANAETSTPPLQSQLVGSIGIVDMDAVKNSYKGYSDFRKQLESRGSALTTQLKERRDEEARLMEQINAYTPGSKEWRKKQVEYQTKKQETASWQKLEQEALSRSEMENLVKIYDELSAGITELAKRRGLALVLRSRKPPSPETARLEARLQIHIGRELLHHGPQLDITKDVIKSLVGKSSADK